ncbi:MAG: polysaccharide export protein [Planctomycetota bacterium]|nr:polysaccharide export protein [Planctomycetota bacterium]
MVHNRIDRCRFLNAQASFCFVALAFLLATGCRTIASLGLPVSSGSNYLLSDAVERREAVGRRTDFATELAKAPLPPHRLEAGDVLVIEPNDFNSPVQIPSDHTVQQEGTIDLGGYGRMQVVGLTIPEIQQEIQFAITRQENFRQQSGVGLVSHSGTLPRRTEENSNFGIAVRLVSRERGVVYVMGEVNSPGSYPIVGSETVLDALITAGGLSDRANHENIILTRPQTEGQPRIILPVCYQQILQLGDTSTNYQLQPGDRIYVPSLTLWEDLKQSVSWSGQQSDPAR